MEFLVLSRKSRYVFRIIFINKFPISEVLGLQKQKYIWSKTNLMHIL